MYFYSWPSSNSHNNGFTVVAVINDPNIGNEIEIVLVSLSSLLFSRQLITSLLVVTSSKQGCRLTHNLCYSVYLYLI